MPTGGGTIGPAEPAGPGPNITTRPGPGPGPVAKFRPGPARGPVPARPAPRARPARAQIYIRKDNDEEKEGCEMFVWRMYSQFDVVNIYIYMSVAKGFRLKGGWSTGA